MRILLGEISNYKAIVIASFLKQEYKDLYIISYDYNFNMYKYFFGALNIPNTDINFGIGSGSHAEQVGHTMIAFEKVLETKKYDLKKEWQLKREKLLSNKIDVTAFMVWLVENYPKNVQVIKNNPDYQYKFK